MLNFARDELAFILDLPLFSDPGVVWNYSKADSHMLSAILTSALGEATVDYARSHLFGPLGITDVEWIPDANGINLGGTHLSWRPRDMVKPGLLYLRGGEWVGQQIVSADWIAFLTDLQLDDPGFLELSYAAHWWHVLLGEYEPMFSALGYGGQYVLVAPDLDLVVVATAKSFVAPNVYITGAADVLKYVQMSERHRGLVGTGTVKWDEVWRGLANANFSGCLVLESFAAINPDIAAATCLWRPPKHSSEVLAREGIEFLKAGIRTLPVSEHQKADPERSALCGFNGCLTSTALIVEMTCRVSGERL